MWKYRELVLNEDLFQAKKQTKTSIDFRMMEPKGQNLFPGFRTNSFSKMSLAVRKRADSLLHRAWLGHSVWETII